MTYVAFQVYHLLVVVLVVSGVAKRRPLLLLNLRHIQIVSQGNFALAELLRVAIVVFLLRFRYKSFHQNFWLTLIVVVVYIARAVTNIGTKATISELNSLSGFTGTLLTLLGISHAVCIAGKLPELMRSPQA